MAVMGGVWGHICAVDGPHRACIGRASRQRMIHSQPVTNKHCASAAALLQNTRGPTKTSSKSLAWLGLCMHVGHAGALQAPQGCWRGWSHRHLSSKCEAIMCWTLLQHAQRQAQHSQPKAASPRHHSTHASQSLTQCLAALAQPMLVWRHPSRITSHHRKQHHHCLQSRSSVNGNQAQCHDTSHVQ